MLEQVDLERSLGQNEYHSRIRPLKIKLYDIGHAVYVSKVPVVVVVEGWACAGKGRLIAELTSALDPRGFRVHPIGLPNCVEQEFPWLQRFWTKVPAYGEMAIFDSSWYRRATIDRASKDIRKVEQQQALQDIQEFERALADDGTVIVKIFLHISEKEQKRRVKRLLSDNATAWRVGEREELEQEKHDRLERLWEEAFAATGAEYAPWTIVGATDIDWAKVQVFEKLIERLEPRVRGQELALPEETRKEADEIMQEDRGTAPGEPPLPHDANSGGESHA